MTPEPLVALLMLLSPAAGRVSAGPDWDALIGLETVPAPSTGEEWSEPVARRAGEERVAGVALSGHSAARWVGESDLAGNWRAGRLSLWRLTQESSSNALDSERVVLQARLESAAAARNFVDAADLRLRRGAGRAERWSILQRGARVTLVIDLAARSTIPAQPLPPDRWEGIEFRGGERR